MLIILNNKRIEPYDDSHLWPYVGQTGFCSAMLYFTRQSTLSQSLAVIFTKARYSIQSLSNALNFKRKPIFIQNKLSTRIFQDEPNFNSSPPAC